VYERTAVKVKELFAHIPEELRLKKIELNRAETRVHNFIEFIASGRASHSLADALTQAEQQVKSLSADVHGMEAAKDHAFTPPPRAWIANRVGKLNQLLAKRTEKSALALRRLTGSVTLSPQKPEVGKSYYRASCKFDVLNLLVEDGGSNLLHWWRRRESKTSWDVSRARFRGERARFGTSGRRVPGPVVHPSARMLVGLGRNRHRLRRGNMSCSMSSSRRWPEPWCWPPGRSGGTWYSRLQPSCRRGATLAKATWRSGHDRLLPHSLRASNRSSSSD